MHLWSKILLVLVLNSIPLFAIIGPVSPYPSDPNGMQHYVFWNSADSSFYHVNTRGASADTHLVKRYQAKFLSRDTLLAKIGSVGYIRDTSYTLRDGNGKYADYIFRNDTQIVIDSMKYYTGAPNGMIVLRDTLVAVHVGSLGLNPAANLPVVFGALNDLWNDDFLILNGKRAKIHHRDGDINGSVYPYVRYRFWVNARECPTGSDVTLNATYKSLPALKTFSSLNESKCDFFADPYQKSKLYLFYISDSGRIVSQVTWDNGLTWEEMYESTRNPILTDTSDHTRSNINVTVMPGAVTTTLNITWTTEKSGVVITST
ncbi:MAG: hypothetical protein JNL74_14285, partial [Fibrobacteres bacterium]|nr:hypothetical protein [Fibrobacterota bacterium]